MVWQRKPVVPAHTCQTCKEWVHILSGQIGYCKCEAPVIEPADQASDQAHNFPCESELPSFIADYLADLISLLHADWEILRACQDAIWHPEQWRTAVQSKER